MTVLQELVRLYDRRAQTAGWPRPGFSTEKIGAEVVLRMGGAPVKVRSLKAPDPRGKMLPQPMLVPAPPPDRRGLKIVPGHFWDPMPYALGVAGSPHDVDVAADRADQKFEAFREHHLSMLPRGSDQHLDAFRAFLESWDPERAAETPGLPENVGENVIFAFEDGIRLHELPVAQALLAGDPEGEPRMCLVSGRFAPPARLHPPIKGVAGAQTAGATLVSFNDDAYTSHGKTQGENAPVSEHAAFAYGTALNALLAKGSVNSLRIGDATLAFWASSGSPAEDMATEHLFLQMMAAPGDDAVEATLAEQLRALAAGKHPVGAPPPSAQFLVLGLAPNAARLSVRFWLTSTLGEIAARVARFWDECAIAPDPFARGGLHRPPRPTALLYDLAAQRDAKNIPPNLAGALMRAILGGTPYPATLLASVIGRLRVEGAPDRARHGDVDGRRAALIRAVLLRNHGYAYREVPMALDDDATDTAYLLGRLFGAYAYAEQSYQPRGASLRSKYLGAASATPARIFPVLMRGYQHNHAAMMKAGDQRVGAGVKADRAVAAIIDRLQGAGDIPAALPLEAQGRFFVGFYHQMSSFFAKAEEAADVMSEPDKESAE